MADIDWKSSDWFVDHHYNNLTEDFKEWWLVFYGAPTDYDDEREYWVRCAFALMGWNKGEEVTNV